MSTNRNDLERINNCDSHKYVSNLKEFRGSNMFALHLEGKGKHTYVVYSYGAHFPMWVYDYVTREWYGTKDKFSPTTSKHQTQSHPDISNDNIHWCESHIMIKIAIHGYNGVVAERLGVEA